MTPAAVRVQMNGLYDKAPLGALCMAAGHQTGNGQPPRTVRTGYAHLNLTCTPFLHDC